MEEICTAAWDGGRCTRQAKASGLCHTHYQRKRTGGDPNAPIRGWRAGPQTCKATGIHEGQTWDCDRPKDSLGYCFSHWKQHKSGKPIKKLVSHMTVASRRDSDGNYLCRTCLQHLPVENFRINEWGPGTDCKSCIAKLRRAARYGLTVEQVADLLAAQDGLCAICKAPAAEDDYTFAVDHDHQCCASQKTCGECLRGILCRRCNLALGGFRDDPKLLQAAITYLTR